MGAGEPNGGPLDPERGSLALRLLGRRTQLLHATKHRCGIASLARREFPCRCPALWPKTLSKRWLRAQRSHRSKHPAGHRQCVVEWGAGRWDGPPGSLLSTGSRRFRRGLNGFGASESGGRVPALSEIPLQASTPRTTHPDPTTRPAEGRRELPRLVVPVTRPSATPRSRQETTPGSFHRCPRERRCGRSRCRSRI